MQEMAVLSLGQEDSLEKDTKTPVQKFSPCHLVTYCVFSSVHLLSRVWLFVSPRTAAHQASLSITNSRSLLKLMPIKLVMPFNHLILCHPLLFLSSIFPQHQGTDIKILNFISPSTLFWCFKAYCFLLFVRNLGSYHSEKIHILCLHHV